MNKNNKILLTFFLIVLLAFGCLFGYHMLNQNKPAVVEKKEEKIKEVSLSGEITSIDNKHIIVNEKQFDISNFEDVFYVHDQVKITYSTKDSKNEWIPVLAIALTKRDEEQVKIQNVMNNMTMDEKVTQMFMVRCPAANAVEMIDQYQFGGYILFDENIYPYTNDQFIANNVQFQQHAKVPMLIGLDEEGGTVNRLSRYENYRAVPFESPRDLYDEGGYDLIRSDTKEKAQLLKSVGVNVNFAPVADLSYDANDFIYQRAFGHSVDETSTYVKTVVEEMYANQIGSVLKHFPGYGNNADTHTGSALDQRPYEQFESEDFLPFKAGISANADSVLVNHNVIENIEADVPASLSKKIHDILRNELEFNGVIFTDDLIMEAITNQYGDELSAVMAVQAGNDMLISSNFTVQIQAVQQAVANGDISENQINESVERILKWKYRLGLFN